MHVCLYEFLITRFLVVGIFNVGVASVDESCDDPCMKTAEGIY